MLVYFLLKYGSTGTWVEKNSVLYFKGRTILHGLDIDIQLSGYHQQYSVPMIDAHWALPSHPGNARFSWSLKIDPVKSSVNPLLMLYRECQPVADPDTELCKE